MLHKIRQRASDEQGFTLIELLVVILIIGILAAIALPSFISQRSKAQDSDAKTVVRTAQTAMETWYTDNQDYQADKPKLEGVESALKDSGVASTLQVTPGDNSYKLTVTSATKNEFSIAKADDGTVTRTCKKVSTKGSCKTDGGNW